MLCNAVTGSTVTGSNLGMAAISFPPGVFCGVSNKPQRRARLQAWALGDRDGTVCSLSSRMSLTRVLSRSVISSPASRNSTSAFYAALLPRTESRAKGWGWEGLGGIRK